MGISGNLKTMELSELLQWLSMGQKTGTLVIDGRKVKKRIFFDKGAIISSASTDPMEHLGRFLINHGYVAEEPVNAAVARQGEKQQLLGKILVDMGTISEDELQQMLLLKAEESIYDVFTWEEGEFEFFDNELPGENMIRMKLDVQMLVLEGTRRYDEWNRIREVVPSTLCVPVLMTDLGSVELDDTDRRILEWVDDDRTVEDISQESQTSVFQTAGAIAAQVKAGVLKVVRPRTVTVEVEVEKEADPLATQAFALPAGMHVQGMPYPSPPPTYPQSPAPTSGSVNLGGRTLHFAAPPAGQEAGSAPAPPAEASPASEARDLLKLAEKALRSGDLQSAAARLVEASGAEGAGSDVRAAIDKAKTRLEDALADQGLRLTSVPKLLCGMDELTQLDISPQEGFLLTRVDGSYDIQSILKMSPMPRLEALMLFWRLKKSGHVRL